MEWFSDDLRTFNGFSLWNDSSSCGRLDAFGRTRLGDTGTRSISDGEVLVVTCGGVGRMRFDSTVFLMTLKLNHCPERYFFGLSCKMSCKLTVHGGIRGWFVSSGSMDSANACKQSSKREWAPISEHVSHM